MDISNLVEFLQFCKRYTDTDKTYYLCGDSNDDNPTDILSIPKQNKQSPKQFNALIVKFNLSVFQDLLSRKECDSICILLSRKIDGDINNLRKKLNRELLVHGFGPTYAEPYGKENHKRVLPLSPVYSPYFIMIYQRGRSTKYKPSYYNRYRLKRVLERNTSVLRDYFSSKELIVRVSRYISKRYHYKEKINIIDSLINNKTIPRVNKGIVIVLTWLEFGGVEKVILNLVKGLHKYGYQITLITTVRSSNPWHDEFTRYSKNIIHLPDILDDSLIDYYDEYIARYTELYSARYLIVTNSMPGYKAMKLVKNRELNIRTADILHTHGTPRDHDAFLRKSMPYKKYIDKRILISNYLKKYYIKKYKVNPNTIKVIYNGMDDEQMKYKPLMKRGIEILKKKSDEIIVSFIGRLEYDKSPERLVEIAHQLSKDNKYRKVRICVCGPGSLEQKMRELIEKYSLDNITMVGPVNNPMDIFAASEYSILTSDSEGIPMSILESMKAGAVVIAPSVGGIPEMIDKNSGYLVNIKNMNEKDKINMFVTVIKKAIDEKDKRLPQLKIKAKKTLDTKFSRMVEDYVSLIES